jgi:hypothetical protein
MDKIWAGNRSGTLGKIRNQNAWIADAVIAASFTSVTVFSRTLTAKEAGLAHAYATDFNK